MLLKLSFRKNSERLRHYHEISSHNLHIFTLEMFTLEMTGADICDTKIGRKHFTPTFCSQHLYPAYLIFVSKRTFYSPKFFCLFFKPTCSWFYLFSDGFSSKIMLESLFRDLFKTVQCAMSPFWSFWYKSKLKSILSCPALHSSDNSCSCIPISTLHESSHGSCLINCTKS